MPANWTVGGRGGQLLIRNSALGWGRGSSPLALPLPASDYGTILLMFCSQSLHRICFDILILCCPCFRGIIILINVYNLQSPAVHRRLHPR